MRFGQVFRFNSKCACGEKFSTLIEVAKPVPTATPRPSVACPSIVYRAITSVFGGDVARDFDAWANDSSRLVYVCACGKTRLAKPVLGKFVAGKVCNDRCMASIGHTCECSCGGRNHGSSHGA